MKSLIPSDTQPTVPQCGSAIRSVARFLCPPCQRIPSASAETTRSADSTSPSHSAPSADDEWFIGSIECWELFGSVPRPVKR